MIRQSHPKLRAALSLVTQKNAANYGPIALRIIIWELMKAQTEVKILKESMDKKMHQVTKRMKTAERDIKAGKQKTAVKVLKKAEKKNERLVKIDKNVRDPLIKKAKEVKAKFPKDWGKVRGVRI